MAHSHEHHHDHDLNALEAVKEHIKHQLKEANVSHSTLEFETPGGHCHDHECDTC